MSPLIILAFVAALGAAIAEQDEKYTSKYDDLAIQDVLKNNRLVKGYINCLLEKGPCSVDGKELKKILPDAIKSNCAHCSEKQQISSRVILRHLIDNEPTYWNQLEKKYDSTGEYRTKYREQAKKEGLLI